MAEIKESDRVHDLFASLEQKVRVAEAGQRAAEEERDSALATAKAGKHGIASMQSDLYELRKVALLVGQKEGLYATFATGWAVAIVDRRHLAAVLACDAVPGDTGALVSSLSNELLWELSFASAPRPLYAAMTQDEMISFRLWWGAVPSKEKK